MIRMSEIKIEIRKKTVPFCSVSSVHSSCFRHCVTVFSIPQNVEINRAVNN
jgi:hypothetical protein